MRIGDLANIRSGYQFREKIVSDPDAPIGVVQIKDIEDRRRLNPATLDRVVLDRDPRPYMTTAGDVLFLSRGHRQFAVPVEVPLRDTVASSYFYILRPAAPNVVPEYLAWYLNQAPMQEIFKSLAKGTHMPFVSKTEFQDLEIPLPSVEVQRRITAVAELAQREQDLLAEFSKKRYQLIQSLTIAAAQRTDARRG
jgi:hypothetical protein